MFKNNSLQLSALNQYRYLFHWLISCAFLIYAMIILGGVTRLTHSGLSMVNWDPLMGAIPPLNSSDWRDLFLQYQQYPEFKLVNSTLTLEEFKTIFYFEYSHRLLGRIIGLAFFIPLIIFWFRGWLTGKLLKKLFVVFLLGAAQGGLGWYMVESGLIDEPRVSHYRLTAHLGLAVALYGAIVWLATGIFVENLSKNHSVVEIKKSIIVLAVSLMIIIYLMILSGGFVAGLRAGLIWNTFPLMGESFFPPGVYQLSPVWLSAFEDMTTVQFNHRMLAYTILVLATYLLFLFFRHKSNLALRRLMLILYLAIGCQIILGITTLLQGVPLLLASLHQACAILVFSLAIVLFKISLENQRLANEL